MNQVYYRVDVQDDHDGGSVWIVYEDFLTSYKEAVDTAKELSLSKSNKTAKVVRIMAEEIHHYVNGNGTTSYQ